MMCSGLHSRELTLLLTSPDQISVTSPPRTEPMFEGANYPMPVS